MIHGQRASGQPTARALGSITLMAIFCVGASAVPRAAGVATRGESIEELIETLGSGDEDARRLR